MILIFGSSIVDKTEHPKKHPFPIRVTFWWGLIVDREV
jgi:hypothetical protein